MATDLQNFANEYRVKTDEELAQLAMYPEQLTPEAFSALTGELARRNIPVPKGSQPQEGPQRTDQPTTRGFPQPKEVHRVRDFVEEVLRIYRSQFWIFVKLTAPAVVVGFIAVVMARNEGREIARHLSPGITSLSHQTEIGLVNLAGYLVSWLAFSFSFAAICSLVDQIARGVTPSSADSLADVGKRLGPFLRLSFLLFVLLLVALAAISLASGGIFWVLRQVQVHPSGLAIQVGSYVAAAVILLLLSRFGLAMAAVILDNYKVGQAMFRSDELTEGKWLTLAALLSKSLIGGYIAGMLPFWIRFWIWSDVHTPAWLATIASIAAVTVVEPTMFIGFALLYLQMSAMPSTSQPTVPADQLT